MDVVMLKDTVVDIGIDNECPVCGENPRYNAKALTAIEEGRAITRGETECPICAAHRDPVTGNPRYNAETVAAIEEGRAMMRGEIPAIRFHSFEEMLEDLEREDPDD